MRRRGFIMGGIAGLLLLAWGISNAQTAPEVIRVDAAAPSRPFPHFWEQMFGSGHANLTMRESWRQDLRAARAVTDFRYVRFHDIFHDHNGVYSETKEGSRFTTGPTWIRSTTASWPTASGRSSS